MANEITYRGALAFLKGDSDSFDFGELQATMTGTKSLRGRQTVTTAEEALILGEVTPGNAWFICKNMDITNKLQIKPGSAQAVMIEVLPGETCGPFRFNLAVVAPFVQSAAGSVDFVYLLVSA
jgi:hypothetical protein